MKFTTAWASVLTQNITLRVAVILLACCSLIFCIATLRLALRSPLVIERGCVSRALDTVDPKHTDREVEAFIKEALPARFDSAVTDSRFLLSSEEMAFRAKEQEELSKKGMRQRVLVNSIKAEGTHFTVDADRLISIGKVRSALPFPLQLDLASVPRSKDNPYGLSLSRVSQVTDGGDAK